MPKHGIRFLELERKPVMRGVPWDFRPSFSKDVLVHVAKTKRNGGTRSRGEAAVLQLVCKPTSTSVVMHVHVEPCHSLPRLTSFTVFVSCKLHVGLITTPFLSLPSPPPPSKRFISSSTFVLHEAHCRRHLTLCEICDELVPTQELEAHHLEYHTPTSCHQCGATMPRDQLDEHLVRWMSTSFTPPLPQLFSCVMYT